MRRVHCVLLLIAALGLAAQLAAQAPSPSKPPPRPQTYGTAQVTYLHFTAADFITSVSSFGWGFSGTGGLCSGVTYLNSLSAPLHLPGGAKVVYLELDFYDINATYATYAELLECDYNGQSCSRYPAAGAGPVDCLTAGYICSGNAYSGGDGTLSVNLAPENITVDTLNGYNLVAGNASGDCSTEINGMILGYVLQVSPPPVSADFDDVPTNHPYFRFIEALYKAGITGGCRADPPMYCPDKPITRGEMAVFLSLALGLQWP